jgi:Histidine kinase-, DNA gyrase B-, and HSP90-like ATPase
MDLANKADANPTKAFFVNIITRDIAIEDCILDLIDNSVDGAWNRGGNRPIGLDQGPDLSEYVISIELGPERFCIVDNCGGMTLDDAADHAFNFGRRPADHREGYNIGVYGIGMKRAVFKLGSEIGVRSTFLEKNGSQLSFAVPISVPKWLEEEGPKWDFDIVAAEHLPSCGVQIVVTSLASGVATTFGSPLFVQNLRRTIGRDYSLHMNSGLKIIVNGTLVVGWKISLRQSKDFAPVRLKYDEDVEGHAISVDVVGGMAAAPPDSSEPTEEIEREDASGWYVACNARIVLAADKSGVAGWGSEDWPSWHPQYRGFIGIVLFTASDASVLPLTTTKRSVDVTSEVFKRARIQMRAISKAWISYTNQRKQSLEEAKQKENDAKSVPIYQIPMQPTVSLPNLGGRVSGPRLASVQYTMSVIKVRDLARALRDVNASNSEVGRRSFEYTYKDLVGDE